MSLGCCSVAIVSKCIGKGYGMNKVELSNLVAEPFDPCCSGCGFEWAWDDLVDGVCPDCVEEEK